MTAPPGSGPLNGSSDATLLAMECKRLRYAFQYDPLLAMSASRVDPLPHQIEAVYGHLLRMPRIRFLLAHDPGAGKTIMAGLLIKELKMRGAIRRILVVAPGPLREQWRWELQDKFDESFEIVERHHVRLEGRMAWNKDQIITSMDFAKRDDVLKSLRDIAYDLVVVDEAHKLSAYHSGKSTTKTQRYRLGEVLSDAGRHLLFLTATPHKGDPANFRLLLDLLEPGYFVSEQMMRQSIHDGNNPLFLRRAKEDMVDFDGRPLFVPRRVETPDVRLSSPERSLYAELSSYIKKQNNLAQLSSRGHNVAFALVLLQRRFASSIHALIRSLTRRRNKLAEMSQPGSARPKSARMDSIPGAGGAEDMSEAERWREEAEWELISAARSRDELEEEVRAIDSLIRRASKVIEKGAETKFRQLRSTLNALDKSEPDEKVLVFTESRDTMEYLVGRLAEMGYAVNTIHGAMGAADRKDAERVFRDKTRIMVATEAAGEGINLQFCHIMINYDLPWNPNRLEQRMGRIHRYGQNRPVIIFNMIYADTREGQIMQTLFDKIQEIKAAIGSDKVFDVISDIVPGKTLAQMMLDATVRARSQQAIMRDMQETMERDNQQILDYLKDGLASKYIDRTLLKDRMDRSRERQLVPEYTGEFFGRTLEEAGGGVKRERGGLVSIRMPDWADQPKSYKTATFDKRVRMANPGVELVTFGHPAFDAAMDWADGEYGQSALCGAVFTDTHGGMDGHIIFCEYRVTDGSQEPVGAKLEAIYVDSGGRADLVNPSILLDLKPGGRASAGDINVAWRAASKKAAAALDDYAAEVRRDRQEQNEASQKYGVRSIDEILARIGDDIVDLVERRVDGDKVDLAIRNRQRERQRYRQTRLDLRMRMNRDATLIPEKPRMVGAVRVVPGSQECIRRREEVVGRVISYERNAGRDAQDVRAAGHGFDVRSTDGDTVRFILAADILNHTVTLSPNQWLRAKTLGADCYLYAVGGGKIVWIRNPGSLRAKRTRSGYLVYLRS